MLVFLKVCVVAGVSVCASDCVEFGLMLICVCVHAGVCDSVCICTGVC